jgi:hypothetical protein
VRNQRVDGLASKALASKGGRSVARNSAGKGKLLEQVCNAAGVTGDVGMDFAVAAFQIGVCSQARPAVPWTASYWVNHIDIVGAD